MSESSTARLQQLNQRRRRAVELRLTGKTLPQIQAEVGLSAPTVIAAYRAFLNRGWAGIALAARGRAPGAGRRLSADEESALRETLLTSQPESCGLPAALWTAAAVAMLLRSRHDGPPQARALERCLQRIGVDFMPLADAVRGQPAAADWRHASLPAITRQAQRQHATLVWCGQATLTGASQPRRLMVAQTLRGSLAWMPLARPYALDSYRELPAGRCTPVRRRQACGRAGTDPPATPRSREHPHPARGRRRV
jgi:sulfate adenylyltransferase subunit 2